MLLRLSQLSRHFSSGMKAQRYMSAVEWQEKLGPYPRCERDESFKETFKSAKHGTVDVADPYHVLGDPFNKTTEEFVKAQSQFTSKMLASCRDRDQLKTALEQSWEYPKKSAPSLKGDSHYYFAYNPGLRAQSATYRIPKDRLGDYGTMTDYDDCLFFDPNLLSDDGTIAKTTSSFSLDGQHYAYALSAGGSDWVTVYVRRTDSPHPANGSIDRQNDGRLVKDVLRHVKFSSIAWLADGSGFLYQRFPAPEIQEGDKGKESSVNADASVWLHVVGTEQQEDVCVVRNESEPDWVYGFECTEDGKWVVLTIFRDTGRKMKIHVAPLTGKRPTSPQDLEWNKVIDEFESEWTYLGNDGSLFYFSTTDQAPKGRILSIDISTNERRELVAQQDSAVLSFAHIAAQDKLVVVYTVDVKSKVFIHDLKTGAMHKQLFDHGDEVIGSVTELTGRREDPDFFLNITTFSTPSAIYRVSFESNVKTELLQETQVGALNPSDFDVRQEFYESADGTRVPMFIVSSRSAPAGPRPTLLYGYGGFSISLLPFASVSLLTFAKFYGGSFAVANLRGGGEYGEDWHLAGTKGNKQNVFDDFHAAAKYLVSTGVTSHDQLAINGGSNGGLLVAACVNQEPELYGAAIAEVGVLDMLRFHRYTIGRLWASDYGCADNPEDFDYLHAYSPLHNINENKVYPPVLLMSADRDDRVVPAHTLKYGATLQHLRADNPNPLLMRIDINSGHGAGKSTAKRIEEAADKFAFLAETMDLKRVP